jgi:secreted PhoX family phosphatase
VAIDGNDDIWVSNKGGNSVSYLNNNGTATPLSGLNAAGTSTGISPSTGYTASGTIASPVGIAVDPSGDVWVINQGNVSATATGFSPALTNQGIGSVTELIGVGAPSYLPLAAAELKNTIGTKP